MTRWRVAAWPLFVVALAPACGDDSSASSSGSETTGTAGDGDGDPGDGDGDGDGDPGDGDGDGGPGDGDGEPSCAWVWEQTEMKLNGQTHAAYDVDVAPNGEFVAVGRIENATLDAWVARFGPDGTKLWERTFDSGGQDFAQAVSFDEAGEVVVVGSLQGNPNKDLWIQQLHGSDGSDGWTVEVASEFDGDNVPGAIARSPDGALVVSATVRAGDQDADIWTRKLSPSDGAAMWTTTYSGVPDMSGFSIDRASVLAVADDGSIFVGGVEGVNFDTREGVLLAYAADGGQPTWSLQPKADGSPHLHESRALAAGPDGEAYFVVAQPGELWDFWLMRTSAVGDIEWEMRGEDFQSTKTDDWMVWGLDVSSDGELRVGGTLSREETGQGIAWSEVWVAHVSLAGQGLCIDAHTWKNTHIIPASTYAYGFGLGPNGTVAVGEIVDGPENYLWMGGFE